MTRLPRPLLRSILASLALLALGGCTSGINAGVEGGIAFIVFAATLVLMVVILWFILGRDE